MFSTVQSEDSRFLWCWKAEAGCLSDSEMHAGKPIAIPRFLSREELRLRVAPTPQRLDRLARLLAEHEHAPVLVEVWQYRFDSQSGKLLAVKREQAKGSP